MLFLLTHETMVLNI